MIKIIISLSLSMTISLLLMMMCKMISKKSTMDREKMSPFECGFDPKSSSRMPFSIQFFLIAILFLIFDIEIVIIIPMIIVLKNNLIIKWFMTVFMFMIILLAGLFYEWKSGALNWSN